MLFIVAVICCLILSEANASQIRIHAYKPLSREEPAKGYLETEIDGGNENAGNRTKKAIASVSDVLQKNLEAAMATLSANVGLSKPVINGTLYEQVTSTEGSTRKMQADAEFPATARNYLSVPMEPTTYRYPTAVWSSQAYEKLKSFYNWKPELKRLPKHSSEYHINSIAKSQRRNRGKTKYKDFRTFHGIEIPTRINRSEFVDRFLEESLTNYLVSSNLKETFGNVSVKTFTEILKNITEEKPKKISSPYDENKELRMKFREEVILKKRNDTMRPPPSAQGKFLEKQLQKRLEKVQDVFNEPNRDKILANMWKYAAFNRTTDFPLDYARKSSEGANEREEATTASSTLEPPQGNSVVYVMGYAPKKTEALMSEKKARRGSVKFDRKKYYDEKEKETAGSRRKVLKLKAEESSYYKERNFPGSAFGGQPDVPGVIPGTPYVDYPIHSFPPPTKFKCPKFKSGKPKMMADKETRCQVFYVCTGEGPTTAMLCPNGTMFNENFLVCDWWYNVQC